MKAAILLLASSAVWAQTAAWQEFSIGPPTRSQAGWPPNGIRADGVPLKRVIARVYGIPENRVFGPEWLADTRYAITAITADPKDFRPQFQKELAGQFHMLAHRENRVVPVFVLKPLAEPAKLAAAKSSNSSTTTSGGDGMNAIHHPHATVAAFADLLGDMVGRPVFDETNLDGAFEIHLRWKAASISALQAAVKDQLGLQLIDEVRAVDLLVIDHIEKLQPSK